MVLGLFSGQRSLLYHPSRYDPRELAQAPSSLSRVRFQTSRGAQVAHYLPPRAGPTAEPRVWVYFAGNASRALDYLDFAREAPEGSVGHLFVDLPGYGSCEGSPDREGVLETVRSVLPALAREHSGARVVGVFGHSLGAATALEFASRHEPERVVLLAPFTSLLDMARRIVGWPLCHLALDRFDNVARLAELSARARRPRVAIFHGDRDEVIPVAMGQDLARRYGARWHPVAGLAHAGFTQVLPDALYAEMFAP